MEKASHGASISEVRALQWLRVHGEERGHRKSLGTKRSQARSQSPCTGASGPAWSTGSGQAAPRRPLTCSVYQKVSVKELVVSLTG